MEGINYIRHLNTVFQLFSKDNRLNASHISLYMALFQFWNYNFFKEEFHINREEVMSYSKIGSKSTYHRCVKELSHWKYVLYMPSQNPFKGSRIKMFNFGTSNEQVMDLNSPESRTSDGQAVVPLLKHMQTIETFKNNTKQRNFGILDFLGTQGKQATTVPFRDNLKTSSDKDYDDPL